MLVFAPPKKKLITHPFKGCHTLRYSLFCRIVEQGENGLKKNTSLLALLSNHVIVECASHVSFGSRHGTVTWCEEKKFYTVRSKHRRATAQERRSLQKPTNVLPLLRSDDAFIGSLFIVFFFFLHAVP